MFTELLTSFFNAMSERDELVAMIAVLDELRKKAAKVEVK